jgi:L-fuconolactonase
MPPAQRVDAHHHVWDLGVRDQPWTAGLPQLRRSFALADLRPHLSANQVGLTVVVQTVCVAEETPELLALAAADPVIGGVVGWVDLCSPGVADELASLRERPGGDRLVGIRHQVQQEPDPRWLCRPDVRRGLRAVSAAGLAYDVVARPHQLSAVVETAVELDSVRFVLDHGGKPPVATGALSPWSAHIASLGLLSNVAVKFSGLVTEADHSAWTVEQLRPYADVLLGAFGAGRTMWGSDWPVCLLAAAYDEVVGAVEQLSAAMSAAERDAIFGGTARAWYALAPAVRGAGARDGRAPEPGLGAEKASSTPRETS